MSSAAQQSVSLDDIAWEALEETVSDFRDDCLGFEYQVQGLFNEIETFYQTLQARAVELSQREQVWIAEINELRVQHGDMLEEIRSLRSVVDRQADQIQKLLK